MIVNSVLQNIGHTPMVRLSLSDGLPGTVWLKLENHNPGGSIKDRVAYFLLEKALASGQIAPGGVVVEPTSGNMGIGLALVSAMRGLKCILVMPESMSIERRMLLKALGAELILTPAARGMSEAVNKANFVVRERDGYMPGQFTNPLAVQAHYENTGPEIYHDCQGKMDVLVAGVGSGSSITGVGRFLKEQIAHFQVIAVEPFESSVLSGHKPAPHLIQGIGAGFIPAILDRAIIDEIIRIEGEVAIAMSRKIMRTEGIVAGISTGANVLAALKVAEREEMRGKNIVTFACDTGERYMSTALFQDLR